MADAEHDHEQPPPAPERIAPPAPAGLVNGSPAARRLLRLQRSAGNRATLRMLQRDETTMSPLTVTSTLGPVEDAVSGLDKLQGVGVDPADVQLGRDEATLRKNSPQATTKLPFKGTGWDAAAILKVLGQYDTNTKTDSDALRCVQSVAIASRIVAGPLSVRSYLSSAIIDGMLSTAFGQRERTAINVLRHVSGRIETQRATFGDLAWAQEALHDLFYDDVSGTPVEDIMRRVSPGFDTTATAEARDTWFDTAEAVMAAANGLAEGEQLLFNTWKVFFNETFLQLEDQGIVVPTGRSQVVNIGGRNVRVRRIDTSAKPAHTAIDTNRDKKSGHQLLIIKDAAVGGLRLYEPEITDSGEHLMALTVDVLNEYFHDHPEIEMYNYMQVLGKLTPTRFATGWPP